MVSKVTNWISRYVHYSILYRHNNPTSREKSSFSQKIRRLHFTVSQYTPLLILLFTMHPFCCHAFYLHSGARA